MEKNNSDRGKKIVQPPLHSLNHPLEGRQEEPPEPEPDPDILPEDEELYSPEPDGEPEPGEGP